MVFQQFYLKCLAHASYLIGDESTGVAAVVDPQRDIAQYLECAAEHKLRIAHVILTHFHADFVAGHLELRDRAGAAVYLGGAATAEFDFTPLDDGSVIAMGRVCLTTLATPGHTPEAISLVVHDLYQSPDAPYAVLTGDTLFVGDVGRPDLFASPGWAAEDLGGMLYESLRTKLMTFDDSTLVYPAHGAGSLCGKALGQETFSTIGEQRRHNYALQGMDKDTFISLVTADQPEAPRYFGYDAQLNAKERETLDTALERELQPRPLGDVLDLQSRGAQLLDTRDPMDFAVSHLQGSLNIGLGGQYATWAGSVMDRDRPIVLITDDGAEREAALRLGRIGFDGVVGYLSGGLAALVDRPDLVASTERLSPGVLTERLGGAEPPLLIDVRNASERRSGAIAGSTHMALSDLEQRSSELPAGRPVVVMCAGGYRSSIAASVLAALGHDRVSELAGGIAAWTAVGLPLDSPSPPA